MASAPPSPAEGEHSSRGGLEGASPRSAITSPPRPTSPTVIDAEEAGERLAGELRSRVQRLQSALDGDDRNGDAADFLDSLTASFEAVVRHPPLAAQRALSVTRDPGAPISRIASLVEQDPGLGQALLRYANSAYYASAGGRVVSLLAAVNRVGTTGVHNVVLRTMVDGMLCRPGSAFQAQVNEVWEHMVRTAPIARALAAPFGVAPDEAYALGLLHDVGKLVIFDRLGELRAARRRELMLSPAIVSAILRLLHETVGGVAALQWGLGGMAADAIATHHRSPTPPGNSPRSELLFVAQHMDAVITNGEEARFEAWWRDAKLGTDRDAVESIAITLAVELSEISAT